MSNRTERDSAEGEFFIENQQSKLTYRLSKDRLKTMKNNMKKTVLPNGMRILTLPMKSRQGVAAGVWIDSGSRDDPHGKEGISHLTEHMIFKGTPSRSALDIARQLESVGGSEDGYTSHEETCYYFYLPGDEIELGMDILGDMISNPSIDADLFKREISVVSSEIGDVEDSPQQVARELFSKAVFVDHPLGKPILGYPATLNSFRPNDVVDFLKDEYIAPKLVLAAVGNIEHERFCDLASRYFDIRNEGTPQVRTSPSPIDVGSLEIVRKDTSQFSIFIGGQSFAFEDKRRYPLAVLDTILGRGASSLLFQRIREEAGIGYRIYSFGEYFSDSGLWGIFASIEPSDANRFFDLAQGIFDELIDGGIIRERFDDTLRGLIGKTKLENDSVSSLLARLVETELYEGKYISLGETLEKLSAITPEDVIEIAHELFRPGRMTGVCLGPPGFDISPDWLDISEDKVA